MIKIGILALQGSVAEHMKSLSGIDGVIACEVKTASDLEEISGLVLPGGESTTIGKLIIEFGLYEPLVKKVKVGLPVWGTCAGMILLASRIVGENYSHLGTMDISVRRNAYGSQLDSFSKNSFIPALSDKEIPLVFIRAPWIEEVSDKVNVLATVNGKIVAAQQANMLATSFHPELTDDLTIHNYFVDMCKKQMG